MAIRLPVPVWEWDRASELQDILHKILTLVCLSPRSTTARPRDHPKRHHPSDIGCVDTSSRPS